MNRNKKNITQTEQLDDKTLFSIVNNDSIALEAAIKGVKEIEPDKINDIDYIQSAANELQKRAQKVLDERAIK